MEIDQVLKRVEWLDDERRKDKNTIAAFEERLVILEGGIKGANELLKELNGEITRMTAVLARVDDFESSLAQHRMEFSRSVDDLEKSRVDRERELEEIQRVQLDGVNNHLADLRKGLEPIPRLEENIKSRIEEDYRLGGMINELRQEILDLQREDEEGSRILRLLEEGQRRSEKRLTDLQGEVLALRKRQDEVRGQQELTSNTIKKVESRLTEVAAIQSERQDDQIEFVEKQALKQVERDRIWKDWASRFETIEKQTQEVDSHLQGLSDANRTIKQAQSSLEKLTERVERRINEITEMQRLAEDRFRQEWVTFKADDQKRWTNYALTQEEQQRESNRQLEKLNGQITGFVDQIQEMKDILHQVDVQTEKRLQSLLAVVRDWVGEYERTFGRA